MVLSLPYFFANPYNMQSFAHLRLEVQLFQCLISRYFRDRALGFNILYFYWYLAGGWKL